MKLKERKEEFLSKVIHDIKTPTSAQINALESFLETSSKKINQEEKDLIKLTLNSCMHVQKLIDDYGCVCRLNCENLKLNYEKFDLCALVLDVIKNEEILLKYNELEIEFNSTNEYIICADKLQIQKVVENILSNSINHAFKKSKIEVFIVKEKSYLTFKVKSNSLYLEPDILGEFFEKYKTNPTPYNKTTTNLSLFLSKEIIRAHFGKMIIDSNPANIVVLGFSVPMK